MKFEAHILGDVFEVLDATFDEATALFELWNVARGCSPEPQIPTTLGIVKLEGEGKFMLLLTVTQQSKLGLDPRDAKGNPAPLDGIPVWTSSDEAIAMVVPEADGLSATVKAVGTVGVCQVNVTADARMGPDIVALAGVLDVSVQAGEAVTLGISTGPVEEQ